MGDVDIRPDLCAEGGGLLDDFDGTVTVFNFESTTYDNKIPEPVTVLRVVIVTDDGDENQELLTLGGFNEPVQFIPDETGFGLKKLGAKSKLTKTCNAVRHIDSYIQAGFPLNRLDPRDVKAIIGVKGHFLRHALDMKGIKKKEGERDKTVLLCTKIISLPGESGVRGKAKVKVKTPDDELANVVTNIIMGVLAENGGEIAKKDLISALFKNAELNALDDKKGALKLAADDIWLKSRGEWKLDGGVLNIA